jgi:hypothetical protein
MDRRTKIGSTPWNNCARAPSGTDLQGDIAGAVREFVSGWALFTKAGGEDVAEIPKLGRIASRPVDF